MFIFHDILYYSNDIKNKQNKHDRLIIYNETYNCIYDIIFIYYIVVGIDISYVTLFLVFTTKIFRVLRILSWYPDAKDLRPKGIYQTTTPNGIISEHVCQLFEHAVVPHAQVEIDLG